MDQKKLNELREYYDNTSLTAEIAAAELNTETAESPMVGITVRLPAELLQQVREAAGAEGVKTTALIRKWIEESIQFRATSAQGGVHTATLSGAVRISNDDDDAVHDDVAITSRDIALIA